MFLEFLLNLLLEIMRILWHSFKDLSLIFLPTIQHSVVQMQGSVRLFFFSPSEHAAVCDLNT